MKRKFLLWLGASLIASALVLSLLPDRIKVWARSSLPTADTLQSLPSSGSPRPPENQAESRKISATATASASAPAGDLTVSRTWRAGELLRSNAAQGDSVERRLLEVFASIEQGDVPTALTKSARLTREHPNYQLGQLVHGDLLKLRFDPNAQLAGFAGSEGNSGQAGQTQLAALRTETRQRLEALHNRPPQGSVPHQFVALSDWSRHAIAIDASQSRLYLFENQPSSDARQGTRLKLVADFFMSVGKSGTGKHIEGDGRTPLGNYYITSVRARQSLPPFYGSGALPINYPNAFDVASERTGFGIWLHGTPPDQFVRAPLASDGCVVLSNPDMQHLLDTVAPRSTPVVIADQLQWTDPDTLTPDRDAFYSLLVQWQQARSEWSAEEFFARFGTPRILQSENDTAANQRSARLAPDASAWLVRPDVKLGVARLSLLQSRLPQPTMVATFEETVDHIPTGVMRRQYWHQVSGEWKLIQDTILAGTVSAQIQRPGAAVALATPAKGSNGTQLAGSGKPVTQKDIASSAKPSQPTATGRSEATSKPTGKPANGDEEAIRRAVQAWASAWSSKNMAGYLAAYDRQFSPPNGMSRKAWEQERRDRIVPKARIQVKLSNVTIRTQGNEATVRFVQNYQADPLNVSSRKTLTMVRKGQQWLIAEEQVGR